MRRPKLGKWVQRTFLNEIFAIIIGAPIILYAQLRMNFLPKFPRLGITTRDLRSMIVYVRRIVKILVDVSSF